MMGKGFFARSALGRSLWGFRREVAWVAVFSTFANVLVLTPTLYMLQVYDRVMLSGSELTLLALTAITVLFFLVMGFAEWVRSRLLVRAGARLDVALNTQVFNASFESNLGRPARNPVQSFNDLTTLRQFLTGNGAFAFFDTPWSLLYIAVLFVMHPWLGWAAVGFALLMSAVPFAGHRLLGLWLEAAQDAGV